MRHFKYLKYIIRHKWYVTLACFTRGLIWQGIKHDWSKFLPCEWIPYANFFYGPKYTEDDRRRCLAVCGTMLDTEELKREKFNRAWLHHQHFNPHHWQYWILRNDDGTTVAMSMPEKYIQEMLADWEGAGMAITGKREYKEWYLKNREKMLLNEATRNRVEELLGTSR